MADPVVSEREQKLLAQQAMWSEWAATAETDIVPDRFKGEPMPDGTVADRPWWFWDDDELHDSPPAGG